MNIDGKIYEAHRGVGARRLVLVTILVLLVQPLWSQTTKAQAREWQAKIRAALFVPTTLPSIDVRSYGSFSPVPGVIAERVSYVTSYGLRVPAIVYRPERIRGKIPGVIVINGHEADKSSWYSWYTGVMYAKAGAFVLTYDPIGEGERNDEHKDATGEHDRVIDMPGLPERMGGSMIVDVMQGVSYLQSVKQVDAHRIAIMGFSMGSFVASLAGALDDRIHAVLLVGGGTLDGPEGYFDTNHMVMCQSGPYRALAFLGDRPAVIFTLHARRGPTFILNGTGDTVMDIPHHGPAFFDDLRKRTIALDGTDKNVFTTAFDEGASHRPTWVTKLAATWLAEQLNFANWNGATIAALPSIKIGDWAEKNDVYLNKSAMREDRDAGLISIDVGAPKLTPEQLSVMPRVGWEKHRMEFVYSAWASAALADAKQNADSRTEHQ